jgi:hypothetical protein
MKAMRQSRSRDWRVLLEETYNTAARPRFDTFLLSLAGGGHLPVDFSYLGIHILFIREQNTCYKSKRIMCNQSLAG